MIIGYYGDLGSGKTLSMTKYAYLYYLKGYEVYSNYGLSFPHKKIDNKFLKDVVTQDTQFNGKTVFALDELDMYFDSRSSMSKNNKIVSYFVKQIRKKNIRLLFAVQSEDRVDKRLRGLTRVKVFCKKEEILVYPKGGDIPFVANLITNQIVVKKGSVTRRFLANHYYNLYDTKELIAYEE